MVRMIAFLKCNAERADLAWDVMDRLANEDPVGLEGGFNLVAYVENNPLNWADPEGLAPRGLPRNPMDLIPLEGGGGGGRGLGGGAFPRWNPGPGEFKPKYKTNPAHDFKSTSFNPNKTPEPQDCWAVYSRSVPDDAYSPRHWWGKLENSQYYRFNNANDGTVHFSGTYPSSSNILPAYVKGWLGK